MDWRDSDGKLYIRTNSYISGWNDGVFIEIEILQDDCIWRRKTIMEKNQRRETS